MPIFGCIADDFTGAGDAASFLQKGGMRVCLFNGLPKPGAPTPEADAYVIALKTRTMEAGQAVRESLDALRFLQAQGVHRFYLKYCSTFDSTPAGNIGPVADALLEALDQPYTLLCPALPVNGRKVSKGILYVNGVPLAQSPMRNHPLTPMRESRIADLMTAQSKYPCLELTRQELAHPEDTLRAFASSHPRFYLIPDYEEDADGALIAERFHSLPLLTGGSGLLTALGQKIGAESRSPRLPSAASGRAILLAGSCSQATLGQIRDYQNKGGASIQIDPIALLSGEDSVPHIWEQARKCPNVLIYTSDRADKVAEAQRHGQAKIAALLEQTLAALAVCARGEGFTRFIIAGGETSGAVTQALGYSQFLIGESIAPGVPVMTPAEAPGIRLILKSGNFGAPTFFSDALKITEV